MAPIRQVCPRQLELLVEFVEANRQLVLSGIGKGPLGQHAAYKAWEELAERLNCIGGGVIKSGDQWKRYWSMIKCRTKTKASDERRMQRGTGGGPNKVVPLSDLEKRIVAVIGHVAVEGLNAVVNPFYLGDENTPPSGPSGSASDGPIRNVPEVGLFEEASATVQRLSPPPQGPRPMPRGNGDENRQLEERRMAVDEERLQIQREQLTLNRRTVELLENIQNTQLQMIQELRKINENIVLEQ